MGQAPAPATPSRPGSPMASLCCPLTSCARWACVGCRTLWIRPTSMLADIGLANSPMAAWLMTRRTRVGNSYSGGNVGGNVSINGQTGGGTVSTTSWTSPVPAPAPTPVATAAPTAQQPAAAPATTAATPAPAPAPAAPTGWAERNAQRNTQVTASSIMDSPERRAAQSASAPVPQQPVPATAPQPPVGGLWRSPAYCPVVALHDAATALCKRWAGQGRTNALAVARCSVCTHNSRITSALLMPLVTSCALVLLPQGPGLSAPALNPAPPAPAPIRGAVMGAG